MFRLIFLFALIPCTSAQIPVCENGSPIPPVNGQCPPPGVLGQLPNGDETCCDPAQTIGTVSPPAATTVAGVTTAATDATSGAATTASSATCVDKVHPRTGVSECAALANLCNDPNYFDVMTRQCPKTCNRCNATSGATTASGACVDLTNLRTGVSDCPALRHLCNDSNYTEVMNKQCRATCGRCGATGGTGTTAAGTAATTAATGTCVDKTNPATGRSDCPAHRSLCTNSAYAALMREQCPATCGFC